MKINALHSDEVKEMVKRVLKSYVLYNPDTSLKNLEPERFEAFVFGLASVIKRRFGSMDLDVAETVLNRGIEGEYNNTVRNLSVPMVFKWLQNFNETEGRKAHTIQEQEYHRNKMNEMYDNYDPPDTPFVKACTLVLYYRFGQLEKWLLKNKISDLDQEGLDVIGRHGSEELINYVNSKLNQ